MFKNFVLSIFVMLSFIQLDAQITFFDSGNVVSFLLGEWNPKEICGGFAGNPCNPIPEENQNFKIEFSKVVVSSNDGNDQYDSTDSIHMSYFVDDLLQYEATAFISFSTTISGEKWNLDYGNQGIKEVIQTSYMPHYYRLALAPDVYDTQTVIYARNTGTTALEDVVANEKIHVFPNPVENILSIDFKSNTIIDKVTILDANGRLASTILNAGSNVDVSNLKSGMYFIKFTDENKMYYSNFIKI